MSKKLIIKNYSDLLYRIDSYNKYINNIKEIVNINNTNYFSKLLKLNILKINNLLTTWKYYNIFALIFIIFLNILEHNTSNIVEIISSTLYIYLIYMIYKNTQIVKNFISKNIFKNISYILMFSSFLLFIFSYFKDNNFRTIELILVSICTFMLIFNIKKIFSYKKVSFLSDVSPKIIKEYISTNQNKEICKIKKYLNKIEFEYNKIFYHIFNTINALILLTGLLGMLGSFILPFLFEENIIKKFIRSFSLINFSSIIIYISFTNVVICQSLYRIYEVKNILKKIKC